MRITFVVAVYPPESEPAAVMAGQLVRSLGRAGHVVTVVCPFPNRPTGRIYGGYRRRLWSHETNGTATMLRVWTWFIGARRRTFDRLLENVSLGVSAGLALLLLPRPDVVVVEVWPIFAQTVCALVCRLRGIPMVNYIQDVYPEAACAAGLLEETGRRAALLRDVDRWVSARAAANVVISPRMKDFLVERRKLPSERFHVVENWLDLDEIKPVPVDQAWRGGLGIGPQDFLCMYAGTLGLASGASVLVEAAARLEWNRGVWIVCIGEGVLRDVMSRQVAELGVSRMRMLPFFPRDAVSAVQSCADAMLLTVAPSVGVSSVPSKLITYLAVGKPVICAVPTASDIADLVSGECLGEVVPPGDAAALSHAILRVREMGEADRERMGQRSRRVALNRFSIDSALRRFNAILERSADFGRN